MRSELFHIPNQIGPIPFLKPEGWSYGLGLLLLIALVWGGLLLFSKYRRQGTGGDFLGSLAVWIAICLIIVFVIPRISEPKGLIIRGYGVMLVVAVVGGVALAMWRASQVGANPEIILSMMFLIFVGGLVGARGMYVIEYWEKYAPKSWDGDGVMASLRSIINVTEGGLAVYGSFLGASVCFGIFVWKYKLPALALCDILVASLLLGQGLGRVGCLLNGCCYGGVCETPGVPSVTFPFKSPAQDHQVRKGQTYLHGLKFPLEAEPPGWFQRQLSWIFNVQFAAEYQINSEANATVAEVEPGSAAEKAGIRPGQRIVGISPAGAAREAKATITNPTMDTVLRELFSLDGKEGREDVMLLVAGEKGAELKRWAVSPAALNRSLPVHPTQVYSAINAWIMALFAWAYFPFRRRDGEVFTLMLMIFPISRFMEEWIRTDESAFVLGMTISQAISLGLILSSSVFWYFILRQPSGGKLTPQDWEKYNARWAMAGSG
jgi:phosphatidylglycerol:prolipoprotein diacylglycerol transferase